MEPQKPSSNIEQLSASLMRQIASKSYGPETMANYRRVLSRVGTFMQSKGKANYSKQVGDEFINENYAKNDFSNSYKRFLKTVIRRLDELSAGMEYRLLIKKPEPAIPPPYQSLLDSYIRSCAMQNNKDSTIMAKRRFCGQFLCYLHDIGCKDIQEINTNNICRAVSSFSNKDSYAAVRAFLLHLHEANILAIDYSGIIPKYKRPSIIPTTYTEEEIRRLESSFKKNTKTEIRDYAILLLATRLGLRSGDIVKLTFENIDFESNSIDLMQDKTGQPLSLPLLPEIRGAIAEYIRNARPNVISKYIFIKANAPYEQMTTSSIRCMLADHFKSAGIDISGKKHGPHSLRSSLASSMINNGVPYEVVRRLLGHDDPEAIKHYAKIDIENLRSYAIGVPAPSGTFERILDGRTRLWQS